MNNKILIWSADLSDYNGQAIVTRHILSKLKISQIKVKKFIYPSFSGVLSTLISIRKGVLFFFTSLLNQSSYSYIVCSRSVPGFFRDLPALFLTPLKKRVIIHIHGSDITDLMQIPFLGLLVRYLYRHPLLIVPSRHLVDELALLGVHNVTLLENFALMSQSVSTPSVPKENIRIIWNSNIISSKGFFEFTEALFLLRSRNIDFIAIILGSPIGDEEKKEYEMKEYIESLKQYEWIRFYGSLPPEIAHNMLKKSDIVVLPSRYRSECQPLSIIDAMCLGKKIVVSDTAALRSTVGEYPAVFCDISSESVLKSILIAISSPKISNEHANVASQRFSVLRFDSLFQNIIDQNLSKR